MRRVFAMIGAVAMTVVGVTGLGSTASADETQQFQNVVVNEVQAAGIDPLGMPSGTDEFVEVANPTPQPVDISGWSLWACSGNATQWNIHNFPAGTVIVPGMYYVVRQVPDYAGPFNATMNVPGVADIPVDGGVELRDATGARVDGVAFTSGAFTCLEGQPALHLFPNPPQDSAQRCPDMFDSNNNAADFQWIPRTPTAPNPC